MSVVNLGANGLVTHLPIASHPNSAVAEFAKMSLPPFVTKTKTVPLHKLVNRADVLEPQEQRFVSLIQQLVKATLCNNAKPMAVAISPQTAEIFMNAGTMRVCVKVISPCVAMGKSTKTNNVTMATHDLEMGVRNIAA